MSQPAGPDVPAESAFWADLREELRDPAFREEFVDMIEDLSERDERINLLRIACQNAYGWPMVAGDGISAMADALGEVLPAHEAMVRAKVAEDFEAVAEQFDVAASTIPRSELIRALARRARGER